jgi:uncharacterized protein YjbI with pentapeptide repeats
VPRPILATTRRLAALATVALLPPFQLAACGADVPAGTDAPAAASDAPPFAALAETLTAERPAGASTTVVLKVAAGSPPGELRVPYRFDDEQVLRKCIPADDERLTAARLVAADGTFAWSHRRGDPCPEAVTVAAATYVLVVEHAAAPRGFVAFVHAREQSDTDARRAAVAAPGMLPDTGDGEYAVLRMGARRLAVSRSPRTPGDDVVLSDGPIDRSALFALRTSAVGGVDHQAIAGKDRLPGEDAPRVLCARAGEAPRMLPRSACDPFATGENGQPATVGAGMRAGGGNTASWCYGRGGPGTDLGLVKTWCLAASAERGAPIPLQRRDDPGASRVIVLNPRYRADASGYRPRKGEVVVFTTLLDPADGPNAALVFDDDTTVDVAGLKAFRFRTGPDTSVAFDGSGWMTGEATVGFGAAVRSIRITASRDLLLSTRSCRGCDLSGLDLSGLDLSGVDLQGASLADVNAERTVFDGARLVYADFSRARLKGAVFTGWTLWPNPDTLALLDGTSFDGADLTGADFSDANLGCVSMRGATLQAARFHRTAMQCVDLGGTDLARALGVDTLRLPGIGQPDGVPLMDDAMAGLCRAARRPFGEEPDRETGRFATVPCKGVRLVGARVWTDAPLVSVWKHVDMGSATVLGPNGETLAGVDLTGLDFRGARFASLDLSGAILRGADLSGADLSGAQLVRADLSCRARDDCTRLAGANLRGAALSYANAKGAVFSGATFSADPTAPPGSPAARAARLDYLYAPNALFDDVDLTGAHLANAQIYGANARLSGVLVRASFAGAVLSDLSLADARLQGTRFDNAVLVNTDFTRAAVGVAGGEPASFAGALLQGANFTGVDASGVDLTGSMVAQAAGTILVQRETAPDQLNWVYAAFRATTTPWTAPTTSCPNGTAGPCTGPQWIAPNPRPPRCIPSPTEFCPPVTAP